MEAKKKKKKEKEDGNYFGCFFSEIDLHVGR